jgi:hypothetical protein
MKNLFITALFLVIGSLGMNAQVTYEDFEGGTPDLALPIPTKVAQTPAHG